MNYVNDEDEYQLQRLKRPLIFTNYLLKNNNEINK